MELHCDEKVLVIIFNLEGKKFLSSYILEGRIFGLKLVKLAVKRCEGGLICIVCMYVVKKIPIRNVQKWILVKCVTKLNFIGLAF